MATGCWLLLLLLLLLDTARSTSAQFSKCCPADQVASPSARCTPGVPRSKLSFSLVYDDPCVFGKRVLSDYRLDVEGTAYSSGRLLRPGEFCVDWVEPLRRYIPFQCVVCSEELSVKVSEPQNVTGDTLVVDGTEYPAKHWWQVGEDSGSYRVCNVTLNKCCPAGQVVFNSSGTCVDNPGITEVAHLTLFPHKPCEYGLRHVNSSLLRYLAGENLCVEWVENSNSVEYFQCLGCERVLSEVVNESRVLQNGSLLVGDSVFESSQWWEEDGVRTCACIHQPCLRKCCPFDSLLNTVSGKCFQMEHNSVPRYLGIYKLIDADPCTNGRYQLKPEEEILDNYTFLPNGEAWMFNTEDNFTLPMNEFCVERDSEDAEFAAFPCFPDDGETDHDAMYTLYPVGMIISEPFLLGTILVYALIPELRNLHGLNLMSHVSSLFVAYLVLAVVQLGRTDLSDQVCQGSAFIIYFSFLASFFWLNVMCLDIWWTFSGFRPMRGSVKEREHKKFIIYSLYCWGCPLIMLIVAMVMDLHPDIPDTYLKPGFGKRRCWFDEDNATLAYFLGPIAVLIICNILLFVLTAIQIRKLKQDTKILKKQESQRHDDDANNTQRFNLYLKLFLVMGVNWIMEVISWAFGGPEYLWYLTDIGNTLQGVLIFIIFVWKDRIRRLLMEKFCPKRAALNASTKSHGTTLTSTTRASTTRHSPNRNANMSVRSSNDTYRMKPLVTSSPSVRSDDSDGP